MCLYFEKFRYSSEPVHVSGESYLHVYDFRFQQPVDDPRNYCYIWVMYGNKSAECTSAHLELHCLVYEWKNYAENFGYIYDVCDHERQVILLKFKS